MKYIKTFESFSADVSSVTDINEGVKLSNAFDVAKKIAGDFLKKMDDKDKEEVEKAAPKLIGKFGTPEEILDKMRGLKELTPEEQKELLKESFVLIEGELNEGFLDTVKKWAARLSATIAAPVSFISGIIGMAATGYNTGWSTSPFLSQVHDAVNAAVGSAGGPLSFLVFALTFVFLFWGVKNWNAAKSWD